MQPLLDSWVGAPVDEMIAAWGVPDGERALSDGRRVYTWSRVVSDGTSFADCSQSFVTDAEGMIVSASKQGSCDLASSAAGPARGK